MSVSSQGSSERFIIVALQGRGTSVGKRVLERKKNEPRRSNLIRTMRSGPPDESGR